MWSGFIVSFTCMVLITQLHTSTACCGDDWHQFDGQCFKFVHRRATWPVARHDCQGNGGGADLAQPYNIGLFADYMKSIGQRVGDPGQKWQIGAQAVFKWISRARGDVSNETPVDNCVMLTWVNAVTPVLREIPCTESWWYICGRPMNTRSSSCRGPSGCIGEAVPVGSQCLTFFSAEDDYLSWEGAAAACIAKGKRLATIENPAVVYNYLTENYPNVLFWAGGSDTANEGTWLWTDGKPLDAQFPWGNTEPNGRIGENCLVVFNSIAADVPCSSPKRRYICEEV